MVHIIYIMIVAKDHGCSLLVLELCLVSVILFWVQRELARCYCVVEVSFGRKIHTRYWSWGQRPCNYFVWLISKLCCTNSVSRRHSLDVILLINLYRNAVSRAGDLVCMIAHASCDGHTKGQFWPQVSIYIYTNLRSILYIYIYSITSECWRPILMRHCKKHSSTHTHSDLS